MTENTLMFHFFAKQELTDLETKQLASICINATDESQVIQLFKHDSNRDLQVSSFVSNCNKVFSLRYYPNQLLYSFELHLMDTNMTIDLMYIQHLKESIKNFLCQINVLEHLHSLLCPVRRGHALWRYFLSSDERLVEVNLSRLVVEKQTKYQNVKIFWGELHGNTLYLDDDVMFAEKDQEPYTRVLLGLETGKPPRNNFVDKEVLILGGGDGGVLCELLKQRPRMVTMCEIDIEVVQLCAQHMREACEDALDTLEGPNKKIIIGDCLTYLHECIQSGKRFDYIVNDLTEFVVNKEERGWYYDFATDNSQVMEIALKALKPDGCYISRGGALSCKPYWTVFEADCQKLGVSFNVRQNFVPSFNEIYLFYEICFVEPESGGRTLDMVFKSEVSEMN